MAFEVYQKGSAPVPTVPVVTIQKGGNISINRAAHLLMGSPEAVELLWDGDRKMIGLRPSELSNTNAYPSKSQSGSDKGPFIVNATLFSQYIKLDVAQARRWTVHYDDANRLLIVPVGEPGQVATSPRGRAAERRAAEAEASTAT